jgi:hypothetical protein
MAGPRRSGLRRARSGAPCLRFGLCLLRDNRVGIFISGRATTEQLPDFRTVLGDEGRNSVEIFYVHKGEAKFDLENSASEIHPAAIESLMASGSNPRNLSKGN